MQLKFHKIRNAGEIDDERVVLHVNSDGDIGRYLIATSHATGKVSVSSKIKYPFWLPDKEVKSGDIIVLYTKKGKESSKENNDGSRSYFYYLGLSAPLYSEEDSCVVLMEVGKWESSLEN